MLTNEDQLQFPQLTSGQTTQLICNTLKLLVKANEVMQRIKARVVHFMALLSVMASLATASYIWLLLISDNHPIFNGTFAKKTKEIDILKCCIFSSECNKICISNCIHPDQLGKKSHCSSSLPPLDLSGMNEPPWRELEGKGKERGGGKKSEGRGTRDKKTVTTYVRTTVIAMLFLLHMHSISTKWTS